MRWARHIAHIVYNILVRKPEGKTLPGRHWRSWECNIRVDLREIGWEGVDWMHLAQDKELWWDLMNTVSKLRVPLQVRNFLTE
jgi:hypothetical protein